MKKLKLILVLISIILFEFGISQNNSLEFDGVDDRIAINKSLNGSSAVTIEAWVYPHSFNPQSPDNYISNVAGHDDAGALLRIGDEDGSNMVDDNRAQFTINTANGVDKCNSTTEMSINTWYHVAGTYDGSNLKIYVNGILEDTEPHSGTISTASSLINIGGPLGTSRYFDGLVDEVRIWNIARTEDQLRTSIYLELQGNESGLIAYYNFNESSGLTAFDGTTNAYNGTLTNMSGNEWQTSSAIFGPKNCIEFDGIDDYVSLGSSADLRPVSAITLECWLNADNWNPSTNHQVFAGNTQSGGYNFAIGYPTSADAGFAVYSNGAYRRVDADITGYSGWHHVAGTFDGQFVKVYIDGDLKDTYDMGSSGNTISYAYSNSFLLGNEAGSGSTPSNYTYSFDGKMDELKVWNIALSQSDIQKNMCKSLTGNESGLMAYCNFDNLSGTILQDFSGNGNDGICIGYNVTLSGTVDWTDYEGSFRDFDANWTVDALIGKTVSITTPGKEQSHVIYDNTDVQLWLDPMSSWFPVITGGETYEITGEESVSWTTSTAFITLLNTTSSSWNEPGNWSTGSTPMPGDNVGIYGYDGGMSLIISGDILEPWECNHFVIDDGAMVSITPGSGFTVYGNLINYGTFKIESTETGTGSLIDNGTILGNGTWQVERYLPADQWCNFSAPVQGLLSGVFELPQVEDPDVFLLQNNEATYSY
ncbi:MAG: LamG domain-containing protein, partial [Bacteroidales bacterium]|nr:LamG domain-containing protein [Bacteroidales bacterium]MCF8403159.1 LamG domain-containing protein [Bacteroidales bacterium]